VEKGKEWLKSRNSEAFLSGRKRKNFMTGKD
jgi:hypothetical protein